MAKVEFDFNQISDLPAFYRDFAHKFALDEAFGANLDALWDVVTAAIIRRFRPDRAGIGKFDGKLSAAC